MKLQNKNTIVTGGASGFGAGIVARFLEEGANVTIVDFDETAALAYMESLKSDRVHFEYADLADGKSVAELFDRLQTRWSRLDVLVNNAGTTHLPALLEDVSEKDFDKVFAVNAKSVYYTSKFAVPWMKQQAAGAIVNNASTAALSPRPHLTWYNASKGWLVTATKSMDIELASESIRVNEYALSLVRRRCLLHLWVTIHRKPEKSFCLPFLWVGFQHQKISPRQRSIWRVMKPR